ncbi:MAG: FAD-dependent oxidoreductase [Bacteroidota bacterium]
MNDKDILILGAGFAGLTASKELAGFGNVTIIDPSPYFEFFPNIHELVSGFKSLEDLRLDLRKIVESRGQTFVQEKAISLDRKNKQVHTESGDSYHYDCLIVAIGGVSNNHGVAGVDEFTYPFKTAAECHAIGERLRHLESKGRPYQITIVGGGVEGIESLGEILRTYGGSNRISINLVEGRDRLLPGMAPQVHQSILKICQDFPVKFHFEQRVDKVEAEQLTLSNQEVLPSDLTIWTGGVKSHPQLESWGLAASNSSAKVNSFLQSEKSDDILVIGDAIDVNGGGEKQAYLAIEMGEVAAQNARAMMKGKSLKRYKPTNLPAVYSFGNLNCFIVYKDFALSGLAFAGLKEAIYQLNMTSIQGIPTRADQVTEVISRGINGTVSSLYSFFDSPVPLLSRVSVELLHPYK